MSFAHRFRLPVSTRHAFALAFDLAVRRDALHSLVTPLIVRGPWVLAVLLLPKPDETAPAGNQVLLSSLAVLGSSITWIAVDAMLRFRARSVFNTPAESRPAPVVECYSRGLKRVPWLYLTEFVRGAALATAFPFFVLPGIFLGHRLAFSTEAVVLDDRSLGSAFQHSFKLSAGRFERWLEMIVVSVLIVLSALFVVAALSLVVPGVGWSTWVIAGWMLVAAIWPVIQYAWTFFYLRLVESEEPAGVEVGPMYATPAPAPSSWTPPSTAPSHLALVEPRRTPPPEEDRTA